MSGMPPPDTEIDPAWAAESNLGWILGVNVVFHVIALGFVCARLYTRIFMVKSFGVDDGLMVASATCALGGGMVTYIISAHYGLGRHRLTIPKEDYKVYMKMTFIQAIVSTIGSLMFLKLSIGFSLLRLNQQKWYKRIILGFIGFVIIYSLVSWIEWFLVCRPLAGFWDKDLGAYCLPQETHKAFALLNTTCNIFTDIVFATLPIPIIWALHMAKKTRIYLIAILSLGYFAVVIGIVKTVCQNVFRGQFDQSFYNWIQFWGFLQINIGIIAACAPTLRPLVSNVLQLSTGSGTRYGSRYPNNNYYASSRNRSRGVSKALASHGRNSAWIQTGSHNNDDFELEDQLRGRNVGNQPRTQIAIGGSPSGSEEMIIPPAENNKGIMRTVSVSVT